MKKKLILPILAILIGGSIFGVRYVKAQSWGGNQDLVQKLAQKFNLNPADVQAVFDADRQEKHAQMETKMEERLSQLVAEGKITESQKQLIIDKHKEMESSMKQDFESFKNLTPEERKSKMEAKKAELENWAKQNGIDSQYLMPRFGMRHGGMTKF